MIRTRLKNGNEAVSFWYGDSLVTEFYDKPGAGQTQISYEQTEGIEGVSRKEMLDSWHQANCDMWEDRDA